jgi:hypothetical protein
VKSHKQWLSRRILGSQGPTHPHKNEKRLSYHRPVDGLWEKPWRSAIVIQTYTHTKGAAHPRILPLAENHSRPSPPHLSLRPQPTVKRGFFPFCDWNIIALQQTGCALCQELTRPYNPASTAATSPMAARALLDKRYEWWSCTVLHRAQRV